MKNLLETSLSAGHVRASTLAKQCDPVLIRLPMPDFQKHSDRLIQPSYSTILHF